MRSSTSLDSPYGSKLIIGWCSSIGTYRTLVGCGDQAVPYAEPLDAIAARRMPTEPAASSAAKVAWVLLVNTTSGGWPTGAGIAARWIRALAAVQPAGDRVDRPSVPGAGGDGLVRASGPVDPDHVVGVGEQVLDHGPPQVAGRTR